MYEEVDYGTSHTSDDEGGEAKVDGVVADTKEDGSVADSENMEVPSPTPRGNRRPRNHLLRLHLKRRAQQ